MRTKVKGTGLFMKEKRMESGLTQMDAAKALGHTTAQYISNMERGLCEPSVEMGITLCRIYDANEREWHDLLLEQYEAQLKQRFFGRKGKVGRSR